METFLLDETHVTILCAAFVCELASSTIYLNGKLFKVNDTGGVSWIYKYFYVWLFR